MEHDAWPHSALCAAPSTLADPAETQPAALEAAFAIPPVMRPLCAPRQSLRDAQHEHSRHAARPAHRMTKTWRPPSVGRPSSQITTPLGAIFGPPRPMDELVIISLVMGLSHLPTGACVEDPMAPFAACAMQTLSCITWLLTS